jgi:formamidopyrimidine-DNA glycosylase
VPELPEVEVIRRDLEREVVGRRIKAVEVTGMRSIRRHRQRKQFVEPLLGRRITGVDRRGKYLVLLLDSEEVVVIHLGMAGRLLQARSARDAPPRHTHVTITFTQGGQLRFVDPRTFGELFVTRRDALADAVEDLAHLGLDPFTTVMSWEAFGDLVARRPAKLKLALMDQQVLAGIGNIYSDEILFNAGLRWDRTTDTLSPEEVRRLYRAVVETLQEAVKHRGSSLADGQYVDLYGRHGGYQEHHRVYAREGRPCPRCRHEIRRIKVAGRSHFFCEVCQV